MLTQEKLIGTLNYSPGPAKMPQAKIRDFLRKFGWVKKHVKGPIAQVFDSAVEPALFRYRPLMVDKSANDDLSKLPVWIREKIYFFDEEGEVVTVKKKITVKEKRFFGRWGQMVEKEKVRKIVGIVDQSSKISEVFMDFGAEAARVHHIISYCRYTQAVIVYRICKEFFRSKLLKEIENKFQKTEAAA